MQIKFNTRFSFISNGTAQDLLSVPSKTRLILFGAGGRGQDVLKQIRFQRPDLEIIKFVDNFKTGQLENMPICSWDDIFPKLTDDDLIIITTFCHEAITKQLKSSGITRCWTAQGQRQKKLWTDYQTLYPKPVPIKINSISLTPHPVLHLETTPGTVIDCKSQEGQCRLERNDLHLKPGINKKAGCRLSAVSKEGKTNSTQISVEAGDWPHKTLEPDIDKLLSINPGDCIYMPESELIETMPDMATEEFKIVKKHFSKIRQPEKSQYQFEDACSIAKIIISRLHPFKGASGDNAKLVLSSPMKLFELAISGKLHVECGHYAQIFTAVCKAFGIAARRITMNQSTEFGRIKLQLGNGHAANEIFCNKSGHWIWMDLQACVLGVQITDGVLLSTLELLSFLNSHRKSSLGFLVFNPESNLTELKRINDLPETMKRLINWSYTSNLNLNIDMQ